jgi:hypothetical protein
VPEISPNAFEVMGECWSLSEKMTLEIHLIDLGLLWRGLPSVGSNEKRKRKSHKTENARLSFSTSRAFRALRQKMTLENCKIYNLCNFELHTVTAPFTVSQ